MAQEHDPSPNFHEITESILSLALMAAYVEHYTVAKETVGLADEHTKPRQHAAFLKKIGELTAQHLRETKLATRGFTHLRQKEVPLKEIIPAIEAALPGSRDGRPDQVPVSQIAAVLRQHFDVGVGEPSLQTASVADVGEYWERRTKKILKRMATGRLTDGGEVSADLLDRKLIASYKGPRAFTFALVAVVMNMSPSFVQSRVPLIRRTSDDSLDVLTFDDNIVPAFGFLFNWFCGEDIPPDSFGPMAQKILECHRQALVGASKPE